VLRLAHMNSRKGDEQTTVSSAAHDRRDDKPRRTSTLSQITLISGFDCLEGRFHGAFALLAIDALRSCSTQRRAQRERLSGTHSFT
jgi:hypothetical protein